MSENNVLVDFLLIFGLGGYFYQYHYVRCCNKNKDENVHKYALRGGKVRERNVVEITVIC